MSTAVQDTLDCFMRGLIKRNPGEPEFHQAVREVAESLMPFILDHSKYQDAHILERMTEPDRIVIFRVCWEDDNGEASTLEEHFLLCCEICHTYFSSTICLAW